MGSIFSIGKKLIVLDCSIVLFWISWSLDSQGFKVQCSEDCVNEIKNLLCSKSANTVGYGSEWNVMCKMLKHHARDFILKHRARIMKTSCSHFLWSNVEKLFGLTYIHPYPQHIVTIYSYSQTCHVWKIPCLSSEWVWYIHAAYTTSSWPAAVTLCASLAVLMM